MTMTMTMTREGGQSRRTEGHETAAGTPPARRIKRYEVVASREEIMRRLIEVSDDWDRSDREESEPEVFVLDREDGIVLSQAGNWLDPGRRTLHLSAASQLDGGTLVDVFAPKMEWHVLALGAFLLGSAMAAFLLLGPIALIPYLLVSLGIGHNRRQVVRKRVLERLVFRALAPLERTEGQLNYRALAAGTRRAA